MSLGFFAQIGIVHVKRKRVSVMETTEIDANIKSKYSLLDAIMFSPPQIPI